MRAALALIALAFATGAAAEAPASKPSDDVAIPISPSLSQLPSPQGQIPCRDTIHQVREERGLPRLDPDWVASEPPQLVAAVDHRINGCSVMVMRSNTSDVRPLPAMPDGPPRLQRIPGG